MQRLDIVRQQRALPLLNELLFSVLDAKPEDPITFLIHTLEKIAADVTTARGRLIDIRRSRKQLHETLVLASKQHRPLWLTLLLHASGSGTLQRRLSASTGNDFVEHTQEAAMPSTTVGRRESDDCDEPSRRPYPLLMLAFEAASMPLPWPQTAAAKPSVPSLANPIVGGTRLMPITAAATAQSQSVDVEPVTGADAEDDAKPSLTRPALSSDEASIADSPTNQTVDEHPTDEIRLQWKARVDAALEVGGDTLRTVVCHSMTVLQFLCGPYRVAAADGRSTVAGVEILLVAAAEGCVASVSSQPLPAAIENSPQTQPVATSNSVPDSPSTVSVPIATVDGSSTTTTSSPQLRGLTTLFEAISDIPDEQGAFQSLQLLQWCLKGDDAQLIAEAAVQETKPTESPAESAEQESASGTVTLAPSANAGFTPTALQWLLRASPAPVPTYLAYLVTAASFITSISPATPSIEPVNIIAVEGTTSSQPPVVTVRFPNLENLVADGHDTPLLKWLVSP